MPSAVRKLQREFPCLNLPENESCRDGFEGTAYGAFSDYPLNSQGWISPKTTAYCAYAPHHQHEVSNSKPEIKITTAMRFPMGDKSSGASFLVSPIICFYLGLCFLRSGAIHCLASYWCHPSLSSCKRNWEKKRPFVH